jgi:hypothetical protein
MCLPLAWPAGGVYVAQSAAWVAKAATSTEAMAARHFMGGSLEDIRRESDNECRPDGLATGAPTSRGWRQNVK